MLNNLSVDKFKPFGTPQSARLAPLTFIYGPNSAGKSSLIQALLLLKQSARLNNRAQQRGGPLSPNGSHFEFGSIRALVNGQKPRQTLRLGIGWDFPRYTDSSDEPFSQGWDGPPESMGVDLSFRLDQEQDDTAPNKHWLSDIVYRFGAWDGYTAKIWLKQHRKRLKEASENNLGSLIPEGVFRIDDPSSLAVMSEKLAWDFQMNGDFPEVYSYEGLFENFISLMSFSTDNFLLPHLVGSEDALRSLRRIFETDPLYSESKLSSTLMSRSVGGLLASQIHQNMEAFNFELGSVLDKIIHLGPLRTPPPRGFVLSNQEGDSGDVGKEGERSPFVFFESTNRKKEQINRWFRNLELDYRVDIDNRSDRMMGDALHLSLRRRRKDPIIRSVSDVGFGVSQVLPIIIQGEVSERKIICVEQPEIHLHPRLQAHIADFLYTTYKSNGNQWIVETHSELLIRRLQHRIRQGRIDPEEVSVLYVNPSSNGSDSSEILELRLDDEGGFIDEWPAGFFEEAYKEMREMDDLPSEYDIYLE